jgi:alkyl hydroperoxide reductase subunit AhpC
VCTTELGYMASIKPEFDKRGVKIIAISTDPAEDSRGWSGDIEQLQGTAVNYPIIADTDHEVAKAYGMLPADVTGDPKARTPAQNATLRNVFVIGPDKQIKLVLIYPMSTGRNFDEILRVIDSLQLTAEQQLSTPAQWQPGEDAIIGGAVSDEAAKERYPDGWEQPLPYMRVVPTR